MARNHVVLIVNNSGREVTFQRQTANNPDRGTITLRPGETHDEPGVFLTYERLVLKNSDGELTDQQISMDELDNDTYEKIEVTRDFRLYWHRRKAWYQKISDWFSDWISFKFRAENGAIPR